MKLIGLRGMQDARGVDVVEGPVVPGEGTLTCLAVAVVLVIARGGGAGGYRGPQGVVGAVQQREPLVQAWHHSPSSPGWAAAARRK